MKSPFRRDNRIALITRGSSGIVCDVTDENDVMAAMGRIKKLDILVNSAGVGLVGNVEETSLTDLQRLFRVNVEGTFLVTKPCWGSSRRRTDRSLISALSPARGSRGPCRLRRLGRVRIHERRRLADRWRVDRSVRGDLTWPGAIEQNVSFEFQRNL